MPSDLRGEANPTRNLRAPQVVSCAGIASVHLTLAVCNYEHVRELTSGVVRLDGITLTPLVFPSIEEITFRFTRNLEWDVSELSFGKYTSLTSQGNAPMIAIPVFPSRVHRHSAIYVRSDHRHPRAQGPGRPHPSAFPNGRRPPASMCAAFWPSITGSISPPSIGCRRASTRPGCDEKVELKLPAGVRYKPRPDTSLSAMLASGRVDAAITARAPLAFAPGGQVDDKPVSRVTAPRRNGCFKKTGVFPIMHLITIRRAVFEQYPSMASKSFQGVRGVQAPLLRALARTSPAHAFRCRGRPPSPTRSARITGPIHIPTASKRAAPLSRRSVATPTIRG